MKNVSVLETDDHINNDDDDQLLPKKTCVYGRVPPHRSISQIVDRSKLQHKMENFFLEKLILLLYGFGRAPCHQGAGRRHRRNERSYCNPVRPS